MNEIVLVYKLLVAFSATFIFIKLIIRFAPAFGLVDVPNHRSIHRIVTPRGAGIGIVFGVMLSDLLLINKFVIVHFSTFLAIMIVFIVGILDDHRDTTPKTKFYVIAAAVLLLAYDGIIVHSLGSLFGLDVTLGWFAIPFTMFAVAGFTNALNLSDGLDGLAGSLSIIILSTLCVIGYENDDFFIVSTSLSFIVSIMAFMWFNWSPAKIFMGDSGSLTLGFVISVLSIKALDYINPISILFIAAIPILDTLIVMIRRKRNGYPIFAPDKLHIHHILLHFFNGSIKKTVGFMILLQLFYSMIGFESAHYKNQLYILIFFMLNLIILYILLNTMIVKQNPFLFRKKRRKK